MTARVIWLVPFVLLLACDRNRVYEENTDLPNHAWPADTVPQFSFDIADANIGYNIYLNLRNGIDYPHSNIYVQYVLSDSLQQPLEKELRNFQLFHPKTGYPFGSGSGGVYAHEFDLLMDYHFPQPGRYSISLAQFMRYEALPEIYSVGVRIEKAAAGE